MTEPTLDQALHQVCSHCGKEFQWHRVTRAGASYCLELTAQAVQDDKYLNREHVPLNLVRIQVSKLRRSPFSKKLGLFTNELLGTYLPIPSQELPA